jgi:hypothetical protein
MRPLSIHPRIELEIDGYTRAMHGSLQGRRRSDQMDLGQASGVYARWQMSPNAAPTILFSMKLPLVNSICGAGMRFCPRRGAGAIPQSEAARTGAA